MSALTRTNPAGVDWTAIRDAAVGATARGWPTVPGTYPVGVGGR
ncbi:MAG: hypothetical protein ACRDSL_12295 [Pseudonocardiaceae bacterium]